MSIGWVMVVILALIAYALYMVSNEISATRLLLRQVFSCPKCKGRGYIYPDEGGDREEGTTKCPHCAGTQFAFDTYAYIPQTVSVRVEKED